MKKTITFFKTGIGNIFPFSNPKLRIPNLRLFAFIVVCFAFSASIVRAETYTLQLSSTNKFATASGSTLTQETILWTATTTSGAINGAWSSGSTGYDGEQFGTTNTPWTGKFSATIAKNITSVAITGSTGQAATLSVSVGGVVFTPATQSVSSGTANKNGTYTFTGTGTGNIVVNVSSTTKAFYLNKIVVTYTSVSLPATTPTFSPTAGTYTSAQSVTLSSTTSGAKIYYTTNGADPSSSSTLYSSPISVSTSTTIKAIAYDSNDANPSSIATAAYTINASSPTITVTGTLNTFANTVMNATSAEQSYTVLGANLTDNIIITPPAGFEISKTTGSDFVTSSGSLTFTPAEVLIAQNVFVRFAPTAAQAYSGNITHTSTGATQVDKAVSGTGVNAEPTNQPTSFTATVNSTSQITVTWTDAAGGQVPAGYLVIASTGTPTAPIDGSAQTDATLVKNITQGTQQAVFTGLSASTTYNFSIWPYTNSGAAIDYKTDGAPTANATTATPLGTPVATAATDISATGFTANWGAAASATGYELDVYQGGDMLSEDFISISTGNSTSTSGSSSAWTGGNTNFPTTSTAYQAGGAVRIGSSSAIGSITTKELNLSSGATLTFDVKGWTTVEGSIAVTVNGANAQTVTYTATISDAFETKTLSIAPSTSASTITIATSAKRAFIDNVVVAIKTSVSGSPFTVTETSKVVSGLSSSTTYYYTVVAKDTETSSEASNKITVFTAIDGAVDASTLPDCATCDLVVNDGGEVTLNASKSYHSVSVKPRAKLTLNNGHAFAPGTFVLESDATGTATFVDKRTNGNKTSITATVKQYLPAAAERLWWYLASPVSDDASTVFGSNKVGEYSETTRSYSSPFGEATTLVAGKGYVVKMTAVSASNYVFSNKAINTGDISIGVTLTVTETANNSKRGFNLVGNPYPSYLNWDMAYNASTNVRPSIWYRTLDNGSMTFHTYNATLGASVPSTASGYIPPMQAFWVKVDTDPVSPATVSNGTINLTNNMRSHNESGTGNPLKAPAVERPLIRLAISNGSTSDETVIVAHASALDSYDSFDSEKMSNENTNVAEIYSLAGNHELVINGISPMASGQEIVLGLRPGKTGDFSISSTQVDNIPTDIKVILKDKLTGAETELSKNASYNFSSDAAETNQRFSLLFRAPGSVTGTDLINKSTLLVYAQQSEIVVNSADLKGSNITVYTATGQSVLKTVATANREVLNGNFTTGVYFVKVNNAVRKINVR